MNKWTNFGKTVIGILQVAMGVGIIVALPAKSDLGMGIIMAGAGAIAAGIGHKITRKK